MFVYSGFKFRSVHQLVRRVDVYKDGLEIQYFAQKNHIKREMRTHLSRLSKNESQRGIINNETDQNQVAETEKLSENFLRRDGSNTCSNGASEGTRTPTTLRSADFESAASTIPPPRHLHEFQRYKTY